MTDPQSLPERLRAAVRKEAGMVDYISADDRRQMGEFLNFVCKTRPEEKWTFGEAHDPQHGWRVVWQVGDVALVHPTNWVDGPNGFIQDLLLKNNDPNMANRQAFLDMLGDWQAWTRRVRERRARGDQPGDKTPLLRSVPTGGLAASVQEREQAAEAATTEQTPEGG